MSKTSIFGSIVTAAFGHIKLAAVQTTITTNPKTGMKFLNLFGDTFPIKDQLSGLGFRYFKGTWGMPLEIAKQKQNEIAALGVDMSVIVSEMAMAPSQPAMPQTEPQPTESKPQTATDKTLAEMKAAIDAELSGPATTERAKRMFDFIDKMIDKIAGSVDEAAKQDFVRSFLAFSARFHDYSFGNQMLIWIQKPDSSYVAGHRQWLEKGRQVSNWGNPITIVRPQKNKREMSDDELRRYNRPAEERIHEWVSFKPAAVYDISDTQPIPGWKDKEGRGSFEVPKLKTNPNEEEEQVTNLVKAAVKFSQSLGITVDIDKELDENLGGYSKGKEIAVNKAFRGINQLSTLAHEMAHEILHRQEDQTTPIKESRRNKEVDAETTAYIVLKHYGYESKDAPNYIALWRATGETVRERRNNIAKAVKIIIAGIDKEMANVIEFEDAPITPMAWVAGNCRFAQAADPEAIFNRVFDELQGRYPMLRLPTIRDAIKDNVGDMHNDYAGIQTAVLQVIANMSKGEIEIENAISQNISKYAPQIAILKEIMRTEDPSTALHYHAMAAMHALAEAMPRPTGGYMTGPNGKTITDGREVLRKNDPKLEAMLFSGATIDQILKELNSGQ